MDSRKIMLLVGALIFAAVGMLLFTALARLERRVNFWHPSVRSA